MQYECRQVYDNYVADMISDGSSGNSKKLWFFIKNKHCDNSDFAPLLKNGMLQSDSVTKANILNDQFVSVFTSKESSSLPDLGPAIHPELPKFSVRAKGIEKLLCELKPFISSGSHNEPAYLLKEGAKSR